MKSLSKPTLAALVCSIMGCDAPPVTVSIDSLSFHAVLITRSLASRQLSCHANRVEAREH